jgi:hypothetical protein
MFTSQLYLDGKVKQSDIAKVFGYDIEIRLDF